MAILTVLADRDGIGFIRHGVNALLVRAAWYMTKTDVSGVVIQTPLLLLLLLLLLLYYFYYYYYYYCKNINKYRCYYDDDYYAAAAAVNHLALLLHL